MPEGENAKPQVFLEEDFKEEFVISKEKSEGTE